MEETVALEESMEDETVADGLMEAEEEPTEAYAESETLVEETEKRKSWKKQKNRRRRKCWRMMRLRRGYLEH